MNLYDWLSKEQLVIKIIIKKSVETVFDLSYLLVDLQSVANGLKDHIYGVNQLDVLDKVACILPDNEDKNQGLFINGYDTHPQWQKEVEKVIESILHLANISVCVDDNVKKQAEHICSELGMSLSTATTLFYKKMINYGRIPFELRVDSFYSKENQEHLENVINNY